MMDYETGTTAATAGQLNKANADSECDVSSDLEAIFVRLSGMTDIASSSCAKLNDFLNRCGRSLPPAENGANPPNQTIDSHFSRIDGQFKALAERLSFISSAADRVSQIG